MFSTITMALSTSIPKAIISEKSTIILSVIPIACNTIKDISILNGIITAAKSEFSFPKNKKSTKNTNIKPVIRLFSSSCTIALISFDISVVRVNFTAGGNSSSASFITAFISSAISKIFAPTRFLIDTDMAGTPFNEAYESLSSKESSTRATSRTYIGLPS